MVVSGAFCDRLAEHVKVREARARPVGALETHFSLQDHISSALLTDGRFGLNGLGSLNVVDRKARSAVNPRTQEKIQVPAKKTVTFKVSPEFKSTLNKH